MWETATARIETDGDNQVVRLSGAFRLKGVEEVRLSHCNEGVLIEPMKPSLSREQIRALLDELDRYKHIPFMENGREQPPMPDDDDLPSFDRCFTSTRTWRSRSSTSHRLR